MMNSSVTYEDAAPELTGRAKVRFHLVDPVVALGMRRKRGVSEENHKAWLAKLADDLAYLTPRNLEALQSYVVRWAGGLKKDVWPEKVSILNAAYALQPIPPREHAYAKTVIRSKMGRVADEQGYLLELFEVARKWGPPPNKYILSKLAERARLNQARLRSLDADRAAGRRITEDDAKWRKWYETELEWCQSIARREVD